MDLQIVYLALMCIFGLILFLLNGRKALYVLLAVSVLLHKELFSTYAWNVLPIRLLMGSLTVYVVFSILNLVRTKQIAKFKKVAANPVGVSLFLFWLIAGASLFFSRNLAASVSVYAFLTTIVALYVYMALESESDGFDVLRLIKAYGLIALVLCVIGFVQLFVFNKFQVIFGAFWNVPGHFPRIGSLFWDVNHFAGFLVLLLPILLTLVLFVPWKQKLVFFPTSVVILLVLVLTNARSGWIAAIVAFLVFCLLRVYKRFKGRGLYVIFFGLVVLASIFLGLYMNKQGAFRRSVRQYFHYRLDSFDSHFLLLNGAWQVFEKYPILGGGYGSFFEQFTKTNVSAVYFARDPAALNTRVPAHSIWGELLAETGTFGFTAMAVFYLGVIFTLLYAALKAKNTQASYLCTAMAGSVIGILTAGIFYSYNTEFFWLIILLYFFYALRCVEKYTDLGRDNLWVGIYAHFIANKKIPLILLATVSFVLIFINLGTNHLIPWDEAIYAKVASNIVDSGDFLTLRWKSDAPWFEKPPLYFWISAILLRVIPDDPELAVRLPSAIAGFFSVLVTYFFGKRLFGKTAGFISGLALLTSFHFLYYSRLGMLDVACTFFILASLYFYHLGMSALSARRKYMNYALSGLFFGLAVLTKGVIGLFPLIIIILYQATTIAYELVKWRRLPKTFKGSMYGLALTLFTSLIVFLPWHLKMYQLYGNEFVGAYLGYHVVERATMEVEDKTAPLFWYVTVLKVSMRLWFIALLPAIVFGLYSVLKRTGDRRNLWFVAVWALAVFILLSMARSKLVWYIMPIYPALAIVVGYFYSSALSFVDRKLSVLKFVTSFQIKAVAIYVTVCVSLLYLVQTKELVYTSDLTGPQAKLIKLKDQTYGLSQKLYSDRVEFPLLLFYTKGPFVATDFMPLREVLGQADKDRVGLVFITKESRFKKLSQEFPNIKRIASEKEWYLGELTVL